jgi:POT family proton-dependent oligopeptide transporter
MLADRWLGAPTAVLCGALLIVLGHVTLSLPLGFGFIPGLVCVALGTSFLKPSIVGLVGNLYTGNLVQKKQAGMSLFYMSISVGGLLGPFALGYLRTTTFVTSASAWHLAFGAAAIGLALALYLYIGFWRTAERARRASPANWRELALAP